MRFSEFWIRQAVEHLQFLGITDGSIPLCKTGSFFIVQRLQREHKAGLFLGPHDAKHWAFSGVREGKSSWYFYLSLESPQMWQIVFNICWSFPLEWVHLDSCLCFPFLSLKSNNWSCTYRNPPISAQSGTGPSSATQNTLGMDFI